MLDEKTLEALSQASNENANEVLSLLRNYLPETQAEAQLIVNLLVPYLKNPKFRKDAYSIFQLYKNSHFGLEYPQELLDSGFQLSIRESEICEKATPKNCLQKNTLHVENSISADRANFIRNWLFFPVAIMVVIVVLWNNISSLSPETSSNLISTAKSEVTKDFSWYTKAAEQGHADAQFMMGECYFYGKGVDKDYEKAVAWYAKAAEQGNADAQFKFGECYYYGAGVELDGQAALDWYTKAAEQGNASAQFSLGVGYDLGTIFPLDSKKSFEWHKKAAEQNHVDSQFQIGLFYEYGEGIHKDYEEARVWYARAAEQGHADAENNLACMLSNGIGGPKNGNEARKLYQRAAEKGNKYAQRNLGLTYYQGEDGAEKDIALAVKLVTPINF